MSTTVRADLSTTPFGRFQVYCDECGFTAQRPSKEDVKQLLKQHVADTHGAKEVRWDEF